MKRISFILVGVIILSVFVYFMFYNGDSTLKVDQKAEPEPADVERESEDDNEDKSETEKGVDIGSLMGEFNFESRGENCKQLEIVVERGDCFQEVHERYLDWWFNSSKEEFYFPIHRDRTDVKDIFYFNIENNELIDLVEADFFEDYDEVAIANGEEWIQEYWYIFSSIIPTDYRKDLTSIYWRDAQGEASMFMGRNSDDLKKFSLYIEYNIGKYSEYMKYLYFHEFAHMLTLNEEQVRIDEELFQSEDEEIWEQEEANCSTFFSWGCHKETSYLNEYYNQYWLDIEDDYLQINWDDRNDYEDFFFNHEDRFFNSYQGTSPIEDIADSFAFFIMFGSEEVQGGSEMKYDKAKFFYQYDDLVELRTMILENIYDLSIKDDRNY